MATIEPRLMHLLNNPNASPSSDSSTYYPPTELPPLQSFSSFAKASNISLPPLEPDAGSSHHEKTTTKTIRQIPSLASIREEYNTGRYSHDGGSERSRQQHSGGISLRMLFDNPEINESSHSLNHILDDVPEPPPPADDGSNKKRHRAMTVKDDIMHLPQPLKKQKSTQNMMSSQNIMPPIINGLYEPPPNAAVFPPIALEDDGGNEAVAQSNLHSLKDFASATMSTANNVDTPDLHEKSQSPPRRESLAPTPEAEKPMAKIKRKAAKPRKKWSEEETRDLLLGVNRYGVGKWTSILEDPQYKFNGRTAGDLKDRFRTCCPDELRIVPSKSKESLNSQDRGASSPAEYRPKTKSKTALLLEDILADPEEAPNYFIKDDAAASAYTACQASQQTQHDSDSTAKPKKSRAHRKKIEDLQAMGIHGPFKKSHRRERRPFTQQDDDQILEGLQLYGPAWTKIQRDPRFDLSSRQPTDLRDRVRNKYPEMYKQIEEKQAPTPTTKEATPSAPGPANIHPPLPTRQAPRRDNVLEPSVSNMINENSLMTLEPHLHRSGSREDMMMPKWAGPSTSGANAGGGGSGGGGSFHELPGMDSFTREALDGEGVDAGDQPGASAAFIGMMDISRLLLDG